MTIKFKCGMCDFQSPMAVNLTKHSTTKHDINPKLGPETNVNNQKTMDEQDSAVVQFPCEKCEHYSRILTVSKII